MTTNDIRVPDLAQNPVPLPFYSPGTNEVPDLIQHLQPSPSRLSQDPNMMSFIANLSNYLPLGCLALECYSTASDQTSLWQDITMPLPLIHESQFTADLSRLLSQGWIRIQCSRSTTDQHYSILRVYVLPEDVGLRFIDRRNSKLSAAMERLIGLADTNPETWSGRYKHGQERKFDIFATPDEHSLFYIFNQISSPAPDPQLIDEKYSREALEDLLEPTLALPGLKTNLYPYQRRSAAFMLQRETISKLELDPRLERRLAPDGTTFYYSPRNVQILRDPRYFEAPKGGILAETMGLGKTVICLSLILATKSHPPKVPSDFTVSTNRPEVPSLLDLAVAAINKHSIPWKVEVDRLRSMDCDNVSASCIAKLEQTPHRYEIPNIPIRWNRATTLPAPQQVTLASTTIIVVPRNLCRQWESEIEKHVENGILNVLVMDDAKRALPGPDTLRTYDIILFSRPRFDMESRHGLDEQGRYVNSRPCQCSYVGSTRTRDCNCVRDDSLYDSPLKYLHFKRLIIDEGHFFGQSNTNTVTVANRLIRSDHRWVVSGTPAKDLLGVEVDVNTGNNARTVESRGDVLEQRRDFSDEDRRRRGAIDSLGLLAGSFLKIRPWSASDHGERAAVWKEHIYSGPRRTPSAFSVCLRRTIESMVVKTRPEDVERDIVLPPLHHKIIRLEPSFYDKLTANMFTLVLTANAVTSERTDTDYLFHKNSQKPRNQLVGNLRQSAFFWTGFSETDVHASVKNSMGYLAKEGTGCSQADRELLMDTLRCTETVLASKGWVSMSRSHELGLFVENWPSESAEHWSFNDCTSPLLTGISQLLEAQQFVNGRLHEAFPDEGLGGVGIRALASTKCSPIGHTTEETRDDIKNTVMGKLGIPASSLNGEPQLRGKAKLSPSKASPNSRQCKSRKRGISESFPVHKRGSEAGHAVQGQGLHGINLTDPSKSCFAKARVVGTTSAKMSYLISQILRYYQSEKILVFYQGDNIAYYVAQVLELMHIRHEIYAKSLSADKQSEYVVRFNQESQDRVLLMDVNQAALGLNLCSASRIYFVNPVCRPNIEAQAIKRAHRIGQTRPVHVETLVLRGTLEERMLERSYRMTRSEHLNARALEDDGGIRDIIQSARRMDFSESERSEQGQMAAFEHGQQLWGRPGWSQFVNAGHNRKRIKRSTSPNDESVSPVVGQMCAWPQVTVQAPLLDVSDQQHNGGDHNNKEPLAGHWVKVSGELQPTPA